jgi:galactokinase
VPTLPELRQRYARVFSQYPRKLAVARAPGRVNLIGEHVDYNDGWVLPAAVTRSAWCVAQRRTDAKIMIYSATVDEKIEFDLIALKFDANHGWANYPKGVLHVLQNRGWKLEGLQLYLESDVPMGGGMSSSAAIELATAYAVMALFPYTLDRLSLVKACQRAENTFVGVQCGIMDQYASGFGRRGHAVHLDCRAVKHEWIPLPLESHRLVVIDSRVKRKLAAGEYNKRRQECQEAVKALKPKFPRLAALRDLEERDLAAALPALPEVPRKRAEHVVRENARVKAAVDALRAGDLPAVGRLLNASHASLRDLYEVSCPELDLLVGTAQQVPGVLGARMMGGGFGGCAIALAEAGAVEALSRSVTRAYQHRFGTTPPVTVAEAGDGAGEIGAPA